MWGNNPCYKTHQTIYCAVKKTGAVLAVPNYFTVSCFSLAGQCQKTVEKICISANWSCPCHLYGAIILRRRFGVSRLTYIFSISFSGRLDPSGKLMNFQPPSSTTLSLMTELFDHVAPSIVWSAPTVLVALRASLEFGVTCPAPRRA